MTRLNLFLFVVSTTISVLNAAVCCRQDERDVCVRDSPDFRSWTWKATPEGRIAVEAALQERLSRLVGSYRSARLPSGRSFPADWVDAAYLRLQIFDDASVALLLENACGELRSAQRSEDGFLTDSSIFLGPADKGLLFHYTSVSNRLYALFSPNGLQERLVFERISCSPDSTWHPRGGTGGGARARLVHAGKQTVSKAEMETWFSQIRGVYVSDEVPPREREKGVRRFWLKINNYNNVYLLRETGDGLHLWMREASWSTIDRTTSFLGDYAAGDGWLSFAWRPPVFDTLERSRLSRLALGRKANREPDRAVVPEEEVLSALSRWADPARPRRRFSRVPDSDLQRDRIKVYSVTDARLLLGEDRKRALELLDDTGYRENPPLVNFTMREE